MDHDHESGDVRGFLCCNWNGGLGQFRDSIDALHAGTAYLDARRAETVEMRALAISRAAGLREAPV